MTTLYYAEHVSTDSDSDSDPFPIVSAEYRNLCPSPKPNPSPAMEISQNSETNSTHKCTSCHRWDRAASLRHSDTCRIRQCSHRSSGRCTGRFQSDTRLCLKVRTKLYFTISSYIRLAKLKIQLNQFCCYCVDVCLFVCLLYTYLQYLQHL